MPTNSFGAASNLRAGDTDYRIFGLRSLEEKGVGNISRLPFTTKILLENLLRQEDGRRVAAADIEYVARGASGSAAATDYRIFGLRSLEEKGVGNISRLPFTTKILLENLLRQEDGRRVAAAILLAEQ